MIANFFQNLNARKVEYLLISGQATVLYGAATFSEDIDLWIQPTRFQFQRRDTKDFPDARETKLARPKFPQSNFFVIIGNH